MLLDAEALASITAARSTFRPDLLELFAERRSMSAMVFRDGGITNTTSGREGGVGVRARHGSSTVHSVSDQLTSEAVRDAVSSAMSLCARQASATWTAGKARSGPLAAARDLAAERRDGAGSDDRARQAALLHAVGDSVTGPNRTSSVTAILRTEERVRDIADSDGGRASCRTRRERVAVTVTVGPSEAPIRGRASIAVNGPETGLTEEDVRSAAAEAIRRAQSRLGAVPAPMGEMPVVLAPGSGAVLIHEALGHGLEADHLPRRSSAFRDLLGQRIGPTGLTIVDDGGLPGGWGTEPFDDEGQPTGRTVLLEDGVLVGYMWDLVHARGSRADGVRSANGRRQNYQCLPMPRMTNTLVLPGTDSGGDVLADTKSGVYVARLGPARVNTATGDFVFTAEESYAIRDGRLCEPLSAHTLIGSGPAVLREIDGIGSDFAMGPPGNCGKDGQTVPVGYGQPTLRVRRGLLVGGTAS